MSDKKLIRQLFRSDVFARDKVACRACSVTAAEVPLDAHHITPREEMPNGGYVVENGITLCSTVRASDKKTILRLGCHERAEAALKGSSLFATGDDKRFSASALYALIGSSKEAAIAADTK